MAHYAFLDSNNVVTEVITGIDETELIEGLDPETWYSNFKGQVCKRTSYNGNYRVNYAGVGFYFDSEANVFIPPNPKCHIESILNTTNYKWECSNAEHSKEF